MRLCDLHMRFTSGFRRQCLWDMASVQKTVVVEHGVGSGISSCVLWFCREGRTGGKYTE